MAKYHITNKAIEDLSDIWNYTLEVWSERQADLYYEMLVTFFGQLPKIPNQAKNTKKLPIAYTDFEPISISYFIE